MVMIIIHIAYITCLVTNELAILRLANTVMGEVGAHNQVVGVGIPLWPRGQDHW